MASTCGDVLKLGFNETGESTLSIAGKTDPNSSGQIARGSIGFAGIPAQLVTADNHI